MKYDEFRNRVLKNLTSYKNNILLCKEEGTYDGQKYSYILPENRKILNLLPTVKNPGRGFKQHIYAHHLNSSQMMCYNFFKPLLDEEEGRMILLDIIRDAAKISIPHDSDIVNDEENGEFIFESPGRNKEGKQYADGTKFDFFLRLSSGQKVYCETKYTECGFSKLNFSAGIPPKYDEKWNKIYKDHLKDSILLNTIDEKTFYSNYQMNRIMSYIRSSNDFVILLLCYDNPMVKEEAEKAVEFARKNNCSNIVMVDWKDMCNSAFIHTMDTRYNRHFFEFKEKYLEY